MKQSIKTMLGVTLLEIMLVLAIAGVVIAMSIRYYQQAAQNQRITAGLGVIASISGAVESFRLAGHPLPDLKKISDLSAYFPGSQTPVSPWTNNTDDVTVSGTSTGTYTITIKATDQNACLSFIETVKGQPAYNTPAPTCTAGVASITVTSG